MTERTDFLLTDFSWELTECAFLAGNEAAWQPSIAARVVEWFGLHGYAVLGTELWVIRESMIQSLPIGRSGMPEAHGNTVNRLSNEPWEAFVGRAASETVAYLRSFQPSEIVERGDVCFNVTWVSKEEFEKIGSSV